MSVAFLISFNAPDHEDLYIPVATQGVYGTDWVPLARKLGLKWLPLFYTGAEVEAADLPAVVGEIRRLRATAAEDPKRAALLERIDFILEELDKVNPDDVSTVFIG